MEVRAVGVTHVHLTCQTTNHSTQAYKKGADNGAADALSRLTTSAELKTMVLSSIETDCLTKSRLVG